MNRILTATALVAMAAFAAAPAFAAAATTTTTKPAMAAAKPAPAVATPAKPVVVTFKTIDANHDGKISFDELHKYFPKVTKDEFAKYDADKDGFYNHAELAAFVKAQQPPKAPMASMMMKPAAKPAATK